MNLHRRTPTRAVLVVATVLALGLVGVPVWSSTAGAAGSYVVDDGGDGVDAAPGDGLCATDEARCTLRAAVEEGTATGGVTTIGFATGSSW